MAGKIVSYAECRKVHADLSFKKDGCQEFMESEGIEESEILECAICGCHRNFHHKVVQNPPVKYITKVIYAECNKNHSRYNRYSLDGCKEFIPKGEEGTSDALTCAVCGCHKGFHRKEVRKEVPVSPPGDAIFR